VEVT